MKLTGIAGTGSGKLGSQIYATVSGQQIVRQYQPRVSNPSTVAQTNQRAIFKLAAQVATSLAPVNAIPKSGLVSARNRFIKENFDLFSASDGVAQVSYENLQLTEGKSGLPAIAVERASATGIKVYMASAVDNSVSRIVYILYKKTDENRLQYLNSIVVTSEGDDHVWAGNFAFVSGELVIFAYGMKDLGAAASSKYANYRVMNGQDIAQLVANRSISSTDFSFTETRGCTLHASENEITVVPEGQARVYVTAQGPGTVSGGGTFTVGTSVTVTATANSGMKFQGWKMNGASQIISTDASYTFTLQATTDLIAVFNDPNYGGGGSDYNEGD